MLNGAGSKEEILHFMAMRSSVQATLGGLGSQGQQRPGRGGIIDGSRNSPVEGYPKGAQNSTIHRRLEVIEDLERRGARGSGFGLTFEQLRQRAAEQCGVLLEEAGVQMRFVYEGELNE